MLIEHYLQIKATHIFLVQFSFFLFAVRGLMMITGSSNGMRPAIKYFTYLIDSLLLIAAILLLIALKINPITTPWVSAKLILLICYIVLGSIALKRGRTKLARSIAYFCALAVFIAIYTIARKHDVNIF